MSNLTPEWRVGDVVLTEAPYMVPFGGVDYGTAERVIDLIDSVLSGGDLELAGHVGNRTVTLPVLIEDSDLLALAEAEVALAAECDKALNEVYCDPGDGFAPAFLWDVFRGQVEFARSDDYEVAGYRAFTLTFRALPYSRSVEETTVTPTPTTIGTGRQQVYSFAVGGAAPTDAAWAVEAGAALGEVFVYGHLDDGRGYSPMLRQYATSATTSAATTDSTLVSGARNMLDTATVFEVPADSLYPGRHQMYARVRGSTSGTANIQIKVETVVGGTVLATDHVWSSVVSNQRVVPIVVPGVNPTAWRVLLLGDIALPITKMGNQSAATVRITFTDIDTSGVDIDLDAAWLFNVSDSAPTWVDCGTGTAAVGGPSKRLFMEPPSISDPGGLLLRGHSADQSDAFYPGSLIGSYGAHQLEGGNDWNVWVVATNTTTAALTVRYWRRWPTHAAA